MERRYPVNEASPYWNDKEWNYAHLKEQIHTWNDELLEACGYDPKTLCIELMKDDEFLQVTCDRLDGSLRTLAVLSVSPPDLEKDPEFSVANAKHSVPHGVIGGIASHIHEILGAERVELRKQGKLPPDPKDINTFQQSFWERMKKYFGK